MAKQYPEISDKLKGFIEKQRIFFVATATADGRVNVSPKGTDSLRVLGKNRVVWLNLTGSGNETSAHVQENPRITIMFSAFQGDPMILRLYGQASVIHRHDSQWPALSVYFEDNPGARQVFDVNVDLVQTSCGMAVPYFDYMGERDQLNKWALKKGNSDIEAYWEEKNTLSIDGKTIKF